MIPHNTPAVAPGRAATHTPRQQRAQDARARALRCAHFADEKKAEQVVVLDVGEVCSFTDAFVICTGSSPLQVRAISDSISEGLKEEGHRTPLVDGMDSLNWVVLDYGDVVVHVMSLEAREFYNLEGLWGDAPEIPWMAGH
ncbi:MAG: ribosome silencing factor [Candidatus Sumerlaeia bacterium]|nr:ribosome silencing factor [Candidatus Sumerlaeia bacterium]